MSRNNLPLHNAKNECIKITAHIFYSFPFQNGKTTYIKDIYLYIRKFYTAKYTIISCIQT